MGLHFFAFAAAASEIEDLLAKEDLIELFEKLNTEEEITEDEE